ncbi:MAG TPA: PD-(D/E)XK nuclease family protein [Candidatus Limnocylindrales bacterium]|nr:PD-(D/E)XK nuclease family protein [Candidatus Limnocylindrales bacterium]
MNESEIQRFFAGIGSRMATVKFITRKDLEHFFREVESRLKLAEDKQRELDRNEGTRFNIFGLIDPDENKFSDILKDLLDPNGTHGQGDVFLRLLIEKLDDALHCEHTAKAKVQREVCTTSLCNQHRRMDILVETDILLAIENKIDAPERENQVKDYLENLAGDTSATGQRYALIYLTPDHRPPDYLNAEDLRINESHLFCWSYQCELTEWLEACRRECKAPKIRFFLSDFITRIKSHMQRKQKKTA